MEDDKDNDANTGDALMMNDRNVPDEENVTIEAANSPGGKRNQRCIILVVLLVVFVVLFVVMTTLFLLERNKNEKTGSSTILKDPLTQAKVCNTADCFETATDLMNSIDPRKDPCENFYEYACDGWITKHPVTEETFMYDQWSLLQKKVDKFIKNSLNDKDIRKHYENVTAVTKAFSLYDSCMNIKDKFPSNANHPINVLIKKYLRWPVVDPHWNKTRVDISTIIAQVTRDFDSQPFFKVFVQTDLKSSSKSMVNVQQTYQWGLFPYQLTRNYSGALRAQSVYKDLIYNVSLLLGANDTGQLRKDAEEIFNIEKLLAKTGRSFRDFDEELYYQKMKVSQLAEATKGLPINWLDLFNELLKEVKYRVAEDEEIIVTDLSIVVSAMQKTLGSLSNRAILNYIGWRIIQDVYQYASQRTDDIRLYFRKHGWNLLSFNKEDQCRQMVKENFGMAMSRVFVDKHFPGKSKQLAQELAQSITKVFQETLKNSDWMDEKSKAAAIEKAEAVQGQYGYPDYLTDDMKIDAKFKRVIISKDSLLDSKVSLMANTKRDELIHMVIPEDRSQWMETPLLVNPYYIPMYNTMFFPAAFLQPPFYDAKYPRAASYGGVGAIIAHELIHGFDSSGKNFDKDGNNVKWWTDLTNARYENRTTCLVNQYSNFIYGGFPVNGEMTLAENIGDNVGLRESFKAYRRWIEEHGEEPSLPGIFNNDQVFFLSYARNWCKSISPIGYESEVFMAEHSPSPFRVNGPLQNFPEFSKVFSCPVGSYMNPADKCSTW